MCLHVKSVNQEPPKLKVAEEDITAYKVLEKRKINYDTFFMTPYQYNIVHTKEVTALGDFIPIFFCYEYCIFGGVIHCYKEQEYAEDLIMMSQHLYKDCFIVKLTIPKGTKYIEGVDDDGRSAIGAEKIVYDCEPSELYNNRVYPK